MICIKGKIVIVLDIQILLNHKSINGKSQSNKLNFDMNMKDFLSTLELNFNQIRLDEIIVNLKIPDLDNNEWLLRETENFCKDRAVYNAILESIHIILKIFTHSFSLSRCCSAA